VGDPLPQRRCHGRRRGCDGGRESSSLTGAAAAGAHTGPVRVGQRVDLGAVNGLGPHRCRVSRLIRRPCGPAGRRRRSRAGSGGSSRPRQPHLKAELVARTVLDAATQHGHSLADANKAHAGATRGDFGRGGRDLRQCARRTAGAAHGDRRPAREGAAASWPPHGDVRSSVIPAPVGPANTAGRGPARRGEGSSAPGRGIGWGQPAAQLAVAPGPVPVPWKPKLVDCRAPTCPL